MNFEGLKMILEGIYPGKTIMLMNQDGELVGTIDAITGYHTRTARSTSLCGPSKGRRRTMNKLMTRDRLEELREMSRDSVGLNGKGVLELIEGASALMVEVARQDMKLVNILQGRTDNDS